MKKVVILGGGVAGMSAAHELIERGFSVEVYEKLDKYVGGKARSVDVTNSGKDGKKDLPGEHGFRFFPGFYKHITDTMSRIPLGKKRKGVVLDNLVHSTRVLMARDGKPPIETLVNFPKSKEDLEVLIHSIVTSDTGLTKEDEILFASKLWELMTSSIERRQEFYERISWWQYTQAEQQCADYPDVAKCPYQEYFVGGLTHTLVAAQPKLMSTKTGGDILLQLIFLMMDPKKNADRVLNAPTNEAWLDPWYEYLTETKGVVYHHGHTVKSINCSVKDRKITSATLLDKNGNEVEATADYYISALPVEIMTTYVNDDMLAIDKTLGFLAPLSESVNWMNGIQYYLDTDVQLTHGHVIFLDSPWAVTAISQLQFWDGYDISKHGNGKVKGILSVDVSDWDTPGLNGKKARECTHLEIITEVWNQMEKSLNIKGSPKVLDKNMWAAPPYLDDDIIIKRVNGKVVNKNAEKLLVNSANTWCFRPETYCGIENMFLASDYIKTNTDLATMEGANEAARRAVNCILAATNSKAKKCKVWKMHEPNILAPLRWLDQKRFNRGEPWSKEVPVLFRILHFVVYWAHRIFKLK